MQSHNIKDYRIYKITIEGNLKNCRDSRISSVEHTYKIIALNPDEAVEMAINIAKNDKFMFPAGCELSSKDIKLIDNRVKN